MKKPHTPREPLSKGARDFLLTKLNRMDKLQRDKSVKRLQMYDRGFKKDKDEFGVEVE